MNALTFAVRTFDFGELSHSAERSSTPNSGRTWTSIPSAIARCALQSEFNEMPAPAIVAMF